MKSTTAFLPPLLVLLLALGATALVVAAAGGDPLVAFSALVQGAFGSLDGLSETAVKICPLLFTGLAVAVAFQAGIWNIGAEGQLLLGAIAVAWVATWVAEMPRWLAVPIALAAAALAGSLWAGVAGVLKVRRDVNEVISTIMLNFIALSLLSYLVQGPLMESAGFYPQTDALPPALRVPRFVSAYRVHLGLTGALLAALATQVLLFRTVIGYELRALGLNVEAARLAGIAVRRNMLLALLVSGALAGIAGGMEVCAVTFRVYERFSPGYGFTAIAVALLGRLHPIGVVLAAVFFGALEAGSNSMQRVAGISSVLVSVIQAAVIFSLLAFERRAWLRAS